MELSAEQEEVATMYARCTLSFDHAARGDVFEQNFFRSFLTVLNPDNKKEVLLA